MKLSFIGVGYVGLVTGACMAEMGHTVICADIDKKKIAKLRKGVMPIYELGLEELVARNVKAGRLSFTTSVRDAVMKSEVVFSAVGTPEDKKTGRADLRYVYAVAESFGKYLGKDFKILVNKSTVPVGTAEKVTKIIRKASGKKINFEVVSNPEFLREGAAIDDFLKPDRVVVGTSSEQARAIMEKVYQPLAKAGHPVMFTDVKSAEIIKYASNAFLATKITFANEIANLCELTGGNVKEVARGMGLDARIGNRFLLAGIGYGGSCFPKDVKALIQTAKDYDYNFRVVSAVDAVNTKQKMKPFEILKKRLKNLKGKKIVVWGLSFKPQTDDVREAPALYLIPAFLKAGAVVHAFDPVAEENAKIALAGQAVTFHDGAYNAVQDADALVIMTEWDEFRTIDFDKLKESMKGKLIIDGRNILDRAAVESTGFEYVGIGV